MHPRTLILSLMLFATSALAADSAKEVASANNAFAFELYSELAKVQGNVFFSPYSISSAFGMAWAGARTQTAEEMAKTLHFGADTHTGFAALNEQLIGKRPGYQLSVANRLYVRNGLELLESYATIAKDQYAAPIEQVDFSEATRQRVNQWVEDQTNKRITDLIPKGSFNADTSMALINTVYFKGAWATAFEKKATTDQPFFTGGKQVKVPLMSAEFGPSSRVRFGQTDGVQVLELPYEDGDVAMVIMLPTARDGLAALEKKLDVAYFEKLSGTLRSTEVDVWLPRFRAGQGLGLTAPLMAMGMPTAFTGGADFSGMTGARGFFISAAIHRSFIEVNEEGTEAAAATALLVGSISVYLKPSFRADHPFLFALRDSKSGSVLFLGRLVDPA